MVKPETSVIRIPYFFKEPPVLTKVAMRTNPKGIKPAKFIPEFCTEIAINANSV